MRFAYILMIILLVVALYYSPALFTSTDIGLTAAEYLNNGKKYRAEENLWKAREAFRLAIKHGQENPEAHYLHGTTQLELGYHAEAIRDFTRALELDPNNGNTYYNRGLARAKSKDFEGALTDFSKALEIQPTDVAAYRDRGLAKLRLQDTFGALDDLKKAVELNPNYTLGLLSYGNALLDFGEKESALEHLNQAVQLDPSLKKHFESAEQCGAIWNSQLNQVTYVPCEGALQ